MKPELKKLLILNAPYLLFVYLFDKIGQAVRLSPGADLSGKVLSLADGFSAAFANPLPSLAPMDLLIGIVGAVLIRLMVYFKGKNAKKYRKGIEYGSARWGNAEDIKPYTDPVFQNNVLLTQTERLTMNSRPKQPKYARNKNILVIGGSGSGKTRFFVKPKRDDIALREKEKEIQKDLDDGIDHIGKKMTVCQLYAKQIRHRANVRHGTKQGRKQLMRILQEDKLGACRIENVKLSDAKEWALRMKEKGYGFKTINNHKRSLKAAFYTAIQDDCIRKNPFDFQLNTVLEDDTEPKEPLSPTQEAAFLSFVQHDKVYQKYYDEIIILLGTGLRISELCGLTEADIDLDKQLINVDHQLLKIADVGYYVETPKTKSGNRVIPMSEKVLEAFQRVLNKRKYVQPVILEGYTKFLFLNRNGLPKVAVNYESMFRGLVRKYNKTQKVALPKVMTPHTLRHTFCTTLANAGMNPKALQYIMGHSNINMTLNYYAHTTSETSITEMKRLIA